MSRLKALGICGSRPADAHHLRFAQPRGLGIKVSDEFTVPLCRNHQRTRHVWADEVSWWRAQKIDPLEVARRLWTDSRNPSNNGATRPASPSLENTPHEGSRNRRQGQLKMRSGVPNKKASRLRCSDSTGSMPGTRSCGAPALFTFKICGPGGRNALMGAWARSCLVLNALSPISGK